MISRENYEALPIFKATPDIPEHQPDSDLPTPKDYGKTREGFRKNAYDWFVWKKELGEIVAILAKPGNQYQTIVTPKMAEVVPRAKTLTGINKTGYYGSYQIEIRADYLSFRVTCKQDLYIPEISRAAIEHRILPKFGRKYRPDGEWFDYTLVKKKIHENTTCEMIYEYLEEGFQKVHELEKYL